MEPWKAALPKANRPPSAATSQYPPPPAYTQTYAPPAPVYAAPPAPVYAAPPAPVYVAPAPVYVAPVQQAPAPAPSDGGFTVRQSHTAAGGGSLSGSGNKFAPSHTASRGS